MCMLDIDMVPMVESVRRNPSAHEKRLLHDIDNKSADYMASVLLLYRLVIDFVDEILGEACKPSRSLLILRLLICFWLMALLYTASLDPVANTESRKLY